MATNNAGASTFASCSGGAVTGSSLSLSMLRSNSAYYHKARVADTGNRTLYASGAFAVSLTIPVTAAWFANHPDTDSFYAMVLVQTYTDSTCATPVGEPVGRAVTVYAAGSPPTLRDGFITVAPEGNPGGFTGYIQGVSRVRVTLDGSKVSYAEGAALASYRVSCQGYSNTGTGRSYLTNVLTGTASVPVTVTVTDTRGGTAHRSVMVTPAAYGAPTVTDVAVFRCNAGGSPDGDGGWLSVCAAAECASLEGQNSVALTVRYRVPGGDWSAGTALTGGTPVLLGGALDPDVSCLVQFTARDALGSETVAEVKVSTRQWAMKFRPDGNGVAFGKSAETDRALELPEDWDVRLGGESYALRAYPVGAVYLSTDSTSPDRLFGGVWEALQSNLQLTGSAVCLWRRTL